MPVDPLAPATLGPVRLRNRVLKAATFEGRTPDALVSDDLIDFHAGFARGGIGMTTVAYLAVAPEGRTHREQIFVREEALPGLAKLANAVHEAGAAINGQLGHAGPVANGRSNGVHALSASRMPSPLSMQMVHSATEKDLTRITQNYVDAAKVLVSAGFDVLELHMAHSYLISSFLAPGLNRRRDGWGGSLENRARLGRQVARAVRDEVGSEVALTAKVSLSDGFKGGVTTDEGLAYAQLLESDGTLDALEMTAGSSLLNPMYLFKGDVPLDEFAAVMPQPIRAGVTLVGHRLLKSYPYSDGFLLEDARQVRAAVDLPMVLLGGVTSREVMDTAMAEGFGFVAMARALLREPDLVNRMQADETRRSLCIHCNKCMPTNFTGTRCVLVDRATTRRETWGTPDGYVA